MSVNTQFNKTLAHLLMGELEWTKMFSKPAGVELTPQCLHVLTSPELHGPAVVRPHISSVLLNVSTLQWSQKHRAVFSRSSSPLKAQTAHLHPEASVCVGWLTQRPVLGVPSWRARRVSASCYSGVFVPQKVWKNTSEMNKPSRPKAAGMTFCGLVAPDFISTLRSKARLLHLTFPLLFQIQEQGILHPSTHRSALKGASSDFIGNQHLSPLLATSLSLS